MNKKELMKLMVNDPRVIRDVLLTDRQISVFKQVEMSESITSKKLTRVMNMSIASASARLNKLHELGYLSRVNHKSRSGGAEFVYMVGI